MNFREIVYGSAEYRQACALRQRVLRAPIGLDLRDEDLTPEASQLHFGLFDGGGALLGCAIAACQPDGRVRIRQMAVAPARQGTGCGRRIMESIEQRLAQRGLTRIFLHARQAVSGFYERLGYVRTGPVFTEVGLPHVLMEKTLRPGPAGDVSPSLDSGCGSS